MSLPTKLAGLFQHHNCAAMAWRMSTVPNPSALVFPRAMPRLRAVPELGLRNDEALFDKISNCPAFEGTRRHCTAYFRLISFMICGVAPEMDRSHGTRRRHCADLAPECPIVISEDAPVNAHKTRLRELP